jgi:hypothetical protein
MKLLRDAWHLGYFWPTVIFVGLCIYLAAEGKLW